MNRLATLGLTGALVATSIGVASGAEIGRADMCGVADAVGLKDDIGDFCDSKGYFENQGSARVQLSTELGQMAVMIDPNVVMDRTIDAAQAFSLTEIVKKISLPGINFVDWEAYSKDGVIYVTQKQNGIDVGIDASKLTFTPLPEEADLQDGVDDELCPTPRDSPDYTGCDMVDFAQNGWNNLPGVGADNDNEVWTRQERIKELKIQDKRCTLEYEIGPIFQDIFENKYDFSQAAGVNLTARVMTVGMIKIQMAAALGVPVQSIVVHLSDEVYDAGLTYSQRLESETRLGDMTDKDREDDWCLRDTNGDQGVTAPEAKLRLIAMAALSPSGYDVTTGEIESGRPELNRLPKEVLDKYGEEFANA